MRRTLLTFLLLLSAFHLKAQDNAIIKEYAKTITTYPYSDPNPVPANTNIYPYFRFDGFTDKAVQMDWKVVELENDYIKITVLPQIGGKIWSAIEKSTGKPFIYENHVVKFRDIAMRGPWTSGGIEPNYGIIGHTPNSVTPVDYITKKNKDGSVSCTISVLDLLTRTTWVMEINLPADKAYFTTRSFWYNSTAIEQPYYHWMNVGIKAAGNLEYIFPGTKYIGHEGEYSDWPVNKQNDKDISFYDNNNFGGPKSYHVFGKYSGFFGAYWHNDDFGMARYADHDDKAGKKIWIWGLSQQGMIWEKLLTDNDGQYSEIQSGRLFNQTADKSTFTPFKHKAFSPGAADTWLEYWYPVKGTNGFVEANNYGALNLKQNKGWLKVWFNPVQKIDDVLEVRQGDKVIYTKKLNLMPLKTFVDSVQVDVSGQNYTVSLGDSKLVYHSKPGFYDLSRPVESPKNFNWDSAYGLYIQGKENMDEKQFAFAEEKLNASLKKDSAFLPALVQMAELMYRNIRYREALELAKRALSVNTNDGAANYYYGLINNKLGNIVDAKDGFDVASLSVEFKSASYASLSSIFLKENNYDKAAAYATKALNYNRFSLNALQVQVIAFRKQGKGSSAQAILDTLLSFNPLDHFAAFEEYLLQPNKANRLAFNSMIRGELPVETYFELAVIYYNNGFYGDALKVLQMAPANSLIYYWMAYLENKEGITNTNYLEKAASASPAFIFPFRAEDEDVLLWATKQNSNWKPEYYLALLYNSKNRIQESKELFSKCGNQPDFAPFYIARAGLQTNKAALDDIKKAIAIDGNEWRYNRQLVQYYISNNQFVKALAVVKPFYDSHPDNYIIGMLYAKALLLTGHDKECAALLDVIKILPFEGATSGRELYREAKLNPAITAIKIRDYKSAMILIEEAKKWPENLGVGKPYQEDIDERLEDWLLYLCLFNTGKAAEAQQYLQKIIRFKPGVSNTIRNFLPANHLITAWAVEKKNGRAAALKWLRDIQQANPGDKTILWCRQIFEHKTTTKPDMTNTDVRLIQHLIDQ